MTTYTYDTEGSEYVPKVLVKIVTAHWHNIALFQVLGIERLHEAKHCHTCSV